MDLPKKYQIILGSIVIISLFVIGVAVPQLQQQNTIVFSETNYDVSSYPHYFWTSFIVNERAELETYLRFQLRCTGLSDVENAWFTYKLFIGNVSVMNVNPDLENSTVIWEMGEHGLSIRMGGSVNLAINTVHDHIMDSSIKAGEYVWAYFIESPNHVTATSLSVTVSLVYK